MTELMIYSAACLAVSNAKTVDDARDIADKAEAMRVYARRAKNRELELDAAEIRIRAERRLGELLIELKDSAVLSSGGRPSLSADRSRVTLKSLGVDQKLSMKAQQLARIDPSRFEAQLCAIRQGSSDARRPRKMGLGVSCGDLASPYEFRVLGRTRLGSIAAGEIDGLLMALDFQAALLRSIVNHCRPGDSLASVEDLIGPETLLRLMSAATGCEV